MTNISRVRTEFSGFLGAPGVATMFFLNTDHAVASVHAFWTGMKDNMPPVCKIQVRGAGDVIDDVTGDLVGAFNLADPALITCTGGPNYAGPVGMGVTWYTSTILDGHRVKGRTYIVPASKDVYDTDGTILAAAITAKSTVAETLRAAEVDNMVIWHRPRAAKAADGSRPAVTARNGGHAVVTGGLLRDKAMVLRSRRG